MLLQVKRWLPDREVIALGDSSYSVIDLLGALQGKVTFITRLRLDAALYGPAPVGKAGKAGRPPKKGKRLPTLEQTEKAPTTEWQEVVFSEWYGQNQKTMLLATGTALWYHSGKSPVAIRWVLLRDREGKLKTTALLSTNESFTALKIVTLFVRRWAIEVTFQEARAHLGVETQRQWSEKSIDPTTPVLLALFSRVTLLADQLQTKGKPLVSTAAWYDKQQPTFSDAIASVRHLLWTNSSFSISAPEYDMVKIPRQQLLLFQQVLAWAA
jgi:hypothetical protein